MSENSTVQSPLISVIVPAYNAEPYLEKCLDSILRQTYERLEIIVVDDGSTDKTRDIADAAAQTDSRIRVIHQENKGLGEARNAGLDIATGELIAFVDSDDWLELNAYEVMTECMARYACDIVTCGRYLQTDTESVMAFCQDKGVLIRSREDVVRRYLLMDGLDMAAWDKLYKARLFNGIRYPAGHLMCEDYVPTYQLLNKARSVYLCGQPLYHYYKHPGAITTAAYSENSMGPSVYGPQVADMVREAYPALKKEADMFEVGSLMYVCQIINDTNGPQTAKKPIIGKLKRVDVSDNYYITKGYRAYIRSARLGIDKPYFKLHQALENSAVGRKILRVLRR